MLGRKDLDALQLRKRALLLESELNRLACAAEWRNVRASAAWAGEAAHTWRQFKPWLVLLAPLAGILVARGARRPVGAVSRVLTILKWGRTLRSIWKDVAGTASSTDSETPAPQ